MNPLTGVRCRLPYLRLFALAAVLLCGGCASIISGRHAEVAFSSYPENAQVVVHDHRGREVAHVHTPGVATLRRNRRFFLPARYDATFVAHGYEPARVPIKSTVNPWVLGNVVIGGVTGLVVDNATGAAWKPRRSEIHQNLMPSIEPPVAASPVPPLATPGLDPWGNELEQPATATTRGRTAHAPNDAASRRGTSSGSPRR